MLNETYRAMLNNKSVIRETFMYGRQRAAQIGSENVFDYSLGNPSVPCPPEFTEAMQTLLAQEEPVSLHGYCPSQGDPGFRTAVAACRRECVCNRGGKAALWERRKDAVCPRRGWYRLFVRLLAGARFYLSGDR